MDSVLNKKEVICGIYMIQCIISGKIYIGQAIDLYSRFHNHRSKLRLNKHGNQKLQNYYNKFGKDNFIYTVLNEFPKNELNFWEKFFIKCFDSYKNGFNLREGGKTSSVYNEKPATLQNLDTKEVITAKSINELSREYGINAKSISAVLNEKSRYVDNWYNPNGKWQPKYYEIIDPNGTIHNFWHISRFAKSQNVSRDVISNVINNKKLISVKGWRRNEERISKQGSPVDFTLMSPDGKIYRGNNLCKFAREHNLDSSELCSLLKKKSKSHKGWTTIDGYKVGIPYKFLSPNGEIFEGYNIRKFALKHNLTQQAMNDVNSGRRKNFQGWTKA